jgi:hypothetical protein
MKSFLLLGLLCIGSVLYAAPRPLPDLDLTTHGEIVIEPDGSVRAWNIDDDTLSAKVQETLAANIRGWRFEPVLLHGKPVAAKTRTTIELEARPHGDRYLLRVSNVSFGSPERRPGMRAPRYPTNAVRAMVGARVMMAARIDREGNVVAVHPYQTSLSRRGSDSETERWRRQFEKASAKAIMEWKFVPGEIIGGEVLESSVMVPVVFSIVGSGAPMRKNVWRAFVPGPIQPVPWVTEESVARIDPDRLGDGEAGSLDSSFRLLSDVIGKEL